MLVPPFSSLFKFDKESLVLRCIGVRVYRSRRQLIGRSERGLALILLDTAIAPMNWNAYLIGLLTVDYHGLNTLRDHRFGDVNATSARHLHLLTTGNTHFICQLRRNLHERLRHKLHVHRIVLGPVMVVLSQA